MNEHNEKSIREVLEYLNEIIEGEIKDEDSEKFLELLQRLDDPVADSSLDIFREEYKNNIARRAKTHR